MEYEAAGKSELLFSRNGICGNPCNWPKEAIQLTMAQTQEAESIRVLLPLLDRAALFWLVYKKDSNNPLSYEILLISE